MKNVDIFQNPDDSPKEPKAQKRFVPPPAANPGATEETAPAAPAVEVIRPVAQKKRKRGLLMVAAAGAGLVLVGGGVAVVGGSSGGVVAAGGPSGSPSSQSESAATDSPTSDADTPDGSGVGDGSNGSGAPGANTGSDTAGVDTTPTEGSPATPATPATPGSGDSEEPPPPEIITVEATVPVEFADRSAALSPEAKIALADLVAEKLDGEDIVVSTYAGFSATEEWASVIAPERAERVEKYLNSLGVSNVITIPEGLTPASVDDAAAEALQRAGISHNRLAIVSTVVVADTP